MARRRGRRPTGESLSLTDLQSALSDASATWQAGDTPLSALSAEEQASFLGLSVTDAELEAGAKMTAAAETLSTARGAIAAPSSVDWRNHSGNFVTPIRDQKSCGSCVSFGTLATIEARANIVNGTPGQNRDYSEAYLFYCGCGNCCGTGWNFAPALEFCKTKGVAAESAFPYTPGNQACKAGVAPQFKISGYSSVSAVADRKKALAERGPVVAGLAIYQDFFSYRSGVYRHVTGALAGYHAVCVIGYDDAQKCWIAKNSWGPAWGESGFFRIGYGEAMIDTSFAFWEPQVPRMAPPTDVCRTYASYLRRVLLAARTNTALRNCLRHYICGRGPRPLVDARCLQIARIVRAILVKCPQLRLSFCRLLG